MEETKPKGIYQKLLEIQKKVMALGKDSSGDSNKFQYVSGSKVLDAIKPIMNSLGVILKQEVVSMENTRMDYTLASGKGKTEILTSAMMRFTWVDCESGEKDENTFAANGQNGFDKGLGSALTYAERYFLLKYFHIATDEDDVDALSSKEGEEDKSKKGAQKLPEGQVKAMTEEQRKTIKKQAEMKTFFSDEQIKLMLTWVAKAQAFDKAAELIAKNETIINHKMQPAK